MILKENIFFRKMFIVTEFAALTFAFLSCTWRTPRLFAFINYIIYNVMEGVKKFEAIFNKPGPMQ